MKLPKWLIGALFLTFMSLFAGFKEISLYCPAHVTVPPVIDGSLEDSCWQQAPLFSATYEYYKPSPGPGKLKNSIRMLYDASGLYLAVINYEEHPEKIRQRFTDYDNPNLWQDDCAEIYIDSRGQGVGFRKFVVSAKGTRGDSLRVDASLSQEEWSGTGWQAKTQIGKDRWTMECFFPWEDLGAKAMPGDTWMFCHVRYAWPDGQFIGTTSSPGGNYNSPGDFGYLCFLADGVTPDYMELGNMISQRVSPPWALLIGNQVYMDKGNGLENLTLQHAVELAVEHCHSLQKVQKNSIYTRLKIPEFFPAAQDVLLKELQECEQLPHSLQLLQKLRKLAKQQEELIWKVKLEQEFN